MKGFFALIGKIVVFAAVIAAAGFVLVRWFVRDPPKVESFGRFEVDGKPALNITQIFAAPGTPAFDPEPNWVPTDWDAKLAHPLTFIDPGDRRWEVPAGQINDGASVPLILHSFVGGGHNGLFLGAAIVHDCYCQKEEARTNLKVDWPDVHKMFYYAMRASKVPEKRAKVMYGAVACFGPPRSAEQWIRLLAEWDAENGSRAKAAKPAWQGWSDASALDQKLEAERTVIAEAKQAKIKIDPQIVKFENEAAEIGKLSSTMSGPVGGIKIEGASEADRLRSQFEAIRREVEALRQEQRRIDELITVSNKSVENLTQEVENEEEVEKKMVDLLGEIERRASSLSLEDIDEMVSEIRNSPEEPSTEANR